MPIPILKDVIEVIKTNANIAGGLWETPKIKLARIAISVTAPIAISKIPKNIIDLWILSGIKLQFHIKRKLIQINSPNRPHYTINLLRTA